MRHVKWRFVRYKNIVYFKGGQQLYGADLERKTLATLIDNLPHSVVGFDFYDPNARIVNGPKRYRQPARGLINNPRMLVLTSDGVISEYDVDSDGTRLKLNNRSKFGYLAGGSFYYVCVCSPYVALSEKDPTGKRAILVVDRLENKLLHAIDLKPGTFN